MDLPISRILSTLLATTFLAAVAFKAVLPGDDPYRCRALQNTGRWIDPPDAEGNRYPFRQWQPDGCILHEYHSNDIRQCTEGRRIVVVGDSTSRGVAYAISRLINKKEHHRDTKLEAFPKLRDNANLTYDGQMIQRLSNVFLASHGNPIQELGGFVQNLDTYADEKSSPPSIQDQDGPALVYVAAGLWFTNDRGNSSRNVPWDPRFAAFKDRFQQLSNFISDNTPDVDPFKAPMDPYDGIGNQIFYGPPAGPCYQGDRPRPIKGSARRASEVLDIHDWLHNTEEETRIPILWSIVNVTTNQNKTWIDPLEKAAHVIEQVAETRANIILNLRCNAKIDRMKRYPYARTCCTDYGGNQYSVIVILCIVYLGACVIYEVIGLFANMESQWRLLNMQLGSFILALLMCYFADRTQIMAKGTRLWEIEGFAVLGVVCFAVLLTSIRHSRSTSTTNRSPTDDATSESLLPRSHTSTPAKKDEQDESFLSRNQTDEWKGWMQCFVLIFNWTAADKGSTSISICFRLCIAAYLFQTGYGHTRFLITSSDFSFNRVVTILLRLNTLSCALAYFMNTDYMFYYAAPLASFWFLVIYATMAIGKQYNDDLQVILTKVFISCILVSTVLTMPLTRWTFSSLEVVFNINWSHTEWIYRATLDMYIVYIGIFTAIVHKRMGGTSINLGLRLVLGLAGLFAIPYYLWRTSAVAIDSYEALHPYISLIPILGFVALRNISTCIRNYHSRAMVWLGRHSLEISILQSHILLAADRVGVLIIDGLFGDGSVLRDRWRTLLILVPIFLWVCRAAKSATAFIIELLLPEVPETDDLDDCPFSCLKALGILQIPYAQIRLACILLTMWLVNLLSTRNSIASSPPGGHELTIMPMPAHALDHPY